MSDDAQKQEFINGFIAAETALKKYEREATETLVPCINELRYSAYHVAQALKAELNGEVSEKQWQRAIRHTHRAKFDVMEFNVALCMDKVEKIKEALNKARFGFTHSSVVSPPQAQSLRLLGENVRKRRQ